METDDLAKVGLETRPDSESRLTALDAALFLDMKMCEWRGILHVVTERGNADAVSALVELKADVNATNSESKTAAVLTQYATCLEELECGRLNADGFTPLTLKAPTKHPVEFPLGIDRQQNERSEFPTPLERRRYMLALQHVAPCRWQWTRGNGQSCPKLSIRALHSTKSSKNSMSMSSLC